MRLFHGTNQHFEQFRRDVDLRSTHGASAESGVFLTTHPRVAEGYAKLAHQSLYPGDHAAVTKKIADLVEAADRCSKSGDYDAYERLILEAEEAEARARDDTSGARVLEVEVEVQNPLVLPNVGRMDLHEMKTLLDSAFAKGHDAVIFEYIWDPGTLEDISERYDHVVISDPALIRIVGFRDVSLEDEVGLEI